MAPIKSKTNKLNKIWGLGKPNPPLPSQKNQQQTNKKKEDGDQIILCSVNYSQETNFQH